MPHTSGKRGYTFFISLTLKHFSPKSLHLSEEKRIFAEEKLHSAICKQAYIALAGIINPGTQAPGLQEAREKLKYYSMTNAERHAYDEHVNAIMIQNDVLGNARLEGMEEGRAEGKIEGKTEEKNSIALKMMKGGMPIEQIMQFTGLSEKEIKSL